MGPGGANGVSSVSVLKPWPARVKSGRAATCTQRTALPSAFPSEAPASVRASSSAGRWKHRRRSSRRSNFFRRLATMPECPGRPSHPLHNRIGKRNLRTAPSARGPLSPTSVARRRRCVAARSRSARRTTARYRRSPSSEPRLGNASKRASARFNIAFIAGRGHQAGDVLQHGGVRVRRARRRWPKRPQD